MVSKTAKDCPVIHSSHRHSSDKLSMQPSCTYKRYLLRVLLVKPKVILQKK